jgi:hypothetical protein
LTININHHKSFWTRSSGSGVFAAGESQGVTLGGTRKIINLFTRLSWGTIASVQYRDRIGPEIGIKINLLVGDKKDVHESY